MGRSIAPLFVSVVLFARNCGKKAPSLVPAHLSLPLLFFIFGGFCNKKSRAGRHRLILFFPLTFPFLYSVSLFILYSPTIIKSDEDDLYPSFSKSFLGRDL